MGKLMDAIERLAFGATAEERVHMLVELAARRVEHRLAVALAENEPPANTALGPSEQPASGEE